MCIKFMSTNLEWELLSEETAWNGFRKLDKRVFKLPTGIVADFEIKREGTPVCVLAITENNTVIMAKQFRPGPMKVLYELPGGSAEKGEDHADAIKRELLEETGYAGDVQFIGTSFADAYSTCLRSNYVATNCRKMQEPKNDEREPIEVVEITLDELRKHLRTGELTDVATGYMGLDFLGLL